MGNHRPQGKVPSPGGAGPSTHSTFRCHFAPIPPLVCRLMTAFIAFRPRPSTDGIDAFAGFLAVASQLCITRGLFGATADRLSLELLADSQTIRFFIVSPTERLVRL